MPKITKIKISNLFGIEEFEGDGSSIELDGKNGAGKTSVLDAIRYCLTNKSDRDFIVKDGEKQGTILLEFDNGLKVQRTKKSEGTDTKNVTFQGMKIGKEESYLKTIFTPLQIDPVKFLGLSKAEQNAMILSLIKYPWNVDTLCELFGVDHMPREITDHIDAGENILSVLNYLGSNKCFWYTSRTDINNEAEHLGHIIEEQNAKLPAGYDAEEWRSVTAGPVYMEVQSVQDRNKRIAEAKAFVAEAENKKKSAKLDYERSIQELDKSIEQKRAGYDEQIASIKKQRDENIERLNEQISAINKMISDVRFSSESKIADVERLKGSLDLVKSNNAENYAVKRDLTIKSIDVKVAGVKNLAGREELPTDELLAKAQNIEHMRSFIRIADEMEQNKKDMETAKKKSAELTRLIERARSLPGVILETADIPVEGLSVKDMVPLINGLPVSNLSEGEKLELCVKIAAKDQGMVQLILIDGTEKLSNGLRDRLYKACKDAGVQVIATRTTEDDVLEVVKLD